MSRKMTVERAAAVNRRRALRDEGPSFEHPCDRVALLDGRPVVVQGSASEPEDLLAIEPRILP